MSTRKWPFPGDSNVARARKVALAYRSLAQQLADEINDLHTRIGKIDPRVLDWVESPPEDPDLARSLKRIADTPAEERGTPVAELDQRFKEWGEDWHAEVPVDYDEDDLIPQAEAAALVQLTPASLGRLRQRGRITAVRTKHPGDPGSGRFYYRVGDVYDLQRERRTRNSRDPDTTVTVPSSGSSDA